jgi:nicotinate phosphoribosyltransferase
VVTSAGVLGREGDRDLLLPLMRGGKLTRTVSRVDALAEARAHHEQVRAALPPEAFALSRGEPVLETVTD